MTPEEQDHFFDRLARFFASSDGMDSDSLWKLFVSYSTGVGLTEYYGTLASYWGPDRTVAESISLALQDLELKTELSVYRTARDRLDEQLLVLLSEVSLVTIQPLAFSEACNTAVYLDLRNCISRLSQLVQSDVLQTEVPGLKTTIVNRLTDAFIRRRLASVEARRLAIALSNNATIGSDYYLPDLVSERLRLASFSDDIPDSDDALVRELKAVEYLVQRYLNGDQKASVGQRRDAILETIEDSIGTDARKKANQLLYSIKKSWENESIPETPYIEQLKKLDPDVNRPN